MPGAKWNAETDLELVFAILTHNLKPNETPRIDWAKVQQMMQGWGHKSSKDAISQRWTKTVLKSFRASHPHGTSDERGEASTAAAANAKTPGSKVGTKRHMDTISTDADDQKLPSKRRRSKSIATDEDEEETPTRKKRKVAARKKAAVQEAEGE
ncbi:hypothetical protein BJ170DRAFT_204668 [Xylariales sp. AK1849]|nr:hypothetical protein BJ170DRAFT_204668 [Xylariales sp. AK1849]